MEKYYCVVLDNTAGTKEIRLIKQKNGLYLWTTNWKKRQFRFSFDELPKILGGSLIDNPLVTFSSVGAIEYETQAEV
jgi:hypothetical protein